jgi:AcrR family transcriptional regulator
MPGKRPRAKRSYDPEGTRNRILDVAASEFQARGYNATSMHDVMHAAGVPGGSMYHYFPTKKSLGVAVIEERVAPEVRQTWIEPVMRSSDPAAAVDAIFKSVARGVERSGVAAGCPLNNLALELSRADRDFQIAVCAVFAEWEDALAERLDDPAQATMVVATFSGAMAMAKASQSAGAIRTCGRALTRALRR